MPKCSLRNCKNNTSRTLKKDGISYFRFPRDPKRCGEWTSFVSQQRREPFFKPNKSSVVCSNHFLDEDIYVSEKGIKLLFKTAIPSVGLSESSDAASNGARKPGTSSKKKNHEPKQSTCERKEIKVFCPKCQAEVSHIAEGILEDQTKALIAKIFHYFEEELELLKKMTAKMKLSHLSKFRYRTAQATGVSEAAVLEILQEEVRRKAAKRYEQPRNAVIQKEVAKNAEIYQEVPQNAEMCQEPPENRCRPFKNPSQIESSNEDTIDSAKDVTQPSVLQQIKIQPENEERIVKEEPMEYYDEQAQLDPISTEVKVEPSNDEMDERYIEEESLIAEAPSYYQLSEELHVEQAQLDPISTEVKVEPSDDEMDERHIEEEYSIAEAPSYYQLSEELHVEQAQLDPISTEVKVEPSDDEMDERHIEEEYSIAEPPSYYQLSEELHVSSLMEAGQVKVEKIEIEDEGFS